MAMQPLVRRTHVQDTSPVGTLDYIDPEYLHTGRFGPSSDTYSLGVASRCPARHPNHACLCMPWHGLTDRAPPLPPPPSLRPFPMPGAAQVCRCCSL